MCKYFLFISLTFFCFLSCKKDKEAVAIEIKKSDKNISVKHKISSKVNTASLKRIESWKEYTAFEIFIKRFEKISPDEAFDNVKELKELTIALEDSLTIKSFKKSSFKSRLHVLENEVLRLNDMSNISAITSKEVNLQIDKIFLVFSSLNDKINTVFDQEKHEEEINLDNFFTMDKKELIEPEKSKKREKKDAKKKIKPTKTSK